MVAVVEEVILDESHDDSPAKDGQTPSFADSQSSAPGSRHGGGGTETERRAGDSGTGWKLPVVPGVERRVVELGSEVQDEEVRPSTAPHPPPPHRQVLFPASLSHGSRDR